MTNLAARAWGVLVLAGVASVARGGDLGRCTLRVTADPPELILGDAARASVRIETGGEVPRVSTSQGRLEPPRQVEPGVFAVDLVPPEATAPQLAIVASSAGEACGWTILRLIGRGDVIVRSTPGARILVRIADQTFGPAGADAEGYATIPVIVPPGVHLAYHGARAIPLSIPPLQRIHVVLDPATARADVDTDVAVRVFATTEEGAPWAGAPVALTTTAGEAPRLTEVGPGELVGRWGLRAGAACEETLTAAVEGRPAATAQLSRVPGPVARIEVAPEAAAAPVDLGEVGVEVRTSDAAGNLVDAEVAPRVDLGGASPSTRTAAGRTRFSVLLPQEAAGRDRIEVTAAVGHVTGRAAISLVAGEPARIAGALSAPALPADGASSGQLRFAVLDAHGIPVPAASPRVEAANVIAALEAERPGFFVLSFRAPRRADDATATLRVDAAGATSSTEVRLIGARPRLELSPGVGVAFTSGHLAVEPSVQAAGWTRRFGPDLGVVLEGGWSARSEHAEASTSAPGLSAEARRLWLHAGGAVRWATSPRALLSLQAGGGFARASSRVRVAGQPSLTEAAWVPSAAASMAWGIRAWRGFPFLELGARWQGDPRLAGLRGAFLPITARAGYRLELL